MFKITTSLKKLALVILILAVGLAAIPITGVSAAGLKEQVTASTIQSNYFPLEKVWAREQSIYQREGNLLAKAGGFIAKAQALIDKASQKGWDTSAVQAALNAFSAVIPAAQAVHDKGSVIITNHAGFDANGKVSNRTTALATAKALAQVLKDTRAAMNGTGKALHQAIKAFRQAHQNTGTPTP